MAERSETSLLLDVHGVHHAYGSFQSLTDVGFEVHRGEIVALVGRNGAGKSTLMRCISGWMPMRDGDAVIEGISLRQRERSYRRHLLLIPDVPVFYSELSAWENLQFIAQVRSLSEWAPEAKRLMESFGLSDHRTAFPSSFSRGMQYKLALCLALLARPDLLLLDEPFGPLDPLSAASLWSELRHFADDGYGVLLSSHQLPAGVEPDRFIALESGRILVDGRTDALRGRYGLEDVTGDALIRSALPATGEKAP